MKTRLLFALALFALGCAIQDATALITMDTVYVGDPGNSPDWGFRGEVDYGYSIGKYEVTVNQYATFLNAVARSDPYSLYHPNMGYQGDIMRLGSSGSYSYSVAGNANKPITYVNWFDAARFANWLQNGQPSGAETVGVTETGAYSLYGATSGVNFTRNANARYGIPSDAEWYKAAYYQPASQGGDTDNWWLYPTRSNTQPNSRNGSKTDPNSANYYYDDGIANGYNGGYAVNNSTTSPIDGRTPVGAFTLASSYYGTFDQGGNVLEWEDFVSGGGRGILGGDFGEMEGAMEAGYWYNVTDPASAYGNVGFRIAMIPEPSTILLLATGASAALICRRRK